MKPGTRARISAVLLAARWSVNSLGSTTSRSSTVTTGTSGTDAAAACATCGCLQKYVVADAAAMIAVAAAAAANRRSRVRDWARMVVVLRPALTGHELRHYSRVSNS